MKYNVSIPELNNPATNLEILGFIKQQLNKLLDALKDTNQEEVRRLSSGIVSLFNKILEQMRENKEAKARQRIEKRRSASDGDDEEEYNTSEEEQSKHHEDAEEIMEEGATCDLTFEDEFLAMDDLERLERLPMLEIEEAIKIVTEIQSKINGS
jgi:DNA repair photolyase